MRAGGESAEQWFRTWKLGGFRISWKGKLVPIPDPWRTCSIMNDFLRFCVASTSLKIMR